MNYDCIFASTYKQIFSTMSKKNAKASLVFSIYLTGNTSELYNIIDSIRSIYFSSNGLAKYSKYLAKEM